MQTNPDFLQIQTLNITDQDKAYTGTLRWRKWVNLYMSDCNWGNDKIIMHLCFRLAS